MTISTYSDLKTALADWGHRSDLTDKLPDFIAQAEARLNDMLVLRDMETESTLSTVVGNNYVALPAGYVSPICLWLIINTYRQLLEQANVEELPFSPSNTQIRYWAIDGDNIRFDCPADQVYSVPFRFVKKSNLSDSTTTNYLLTERPDIYLAGGLVSMARYTQNRELLAMWEPKFMQACAEFKARESRARADVPLRVDIGLRSRSNAFNIYRGN